VAIELPTGAGKTLVGLLIAEFRRQTFNERVAYLCPTRQLARQVHAQALKYGIRTHVFVGKQRDYPPLEFGEFQTSQAIGITTYSGIFNSNPRI
jgi:replicative superfamily II helicase